MFSTLPSRATILTALDCHFRICVRRGASGGHLNWFDSRYYSRFSSLSERFIKVTSEFGFGLPHNPETDTVPIVL